MGSLPSDAELPWIKTPCLHSPPLSKAAGCNIYLKFDNLQPSGSFKSRGIGNLMRQAAAASTSDQVHFYCSSGGNAGLACAHSAKLLRRPATIVVPTSTSPLMKSKLLALGVDVKQVGRNWPEADAYLRSELLTADPHGVYVPPFDHPQVWAGAATIISELREQMPTDAAIDAIVCSVGGGGLLNGIMQGVNAASWPRKSEDGAEVNASPLVIAVETEGADSLNASVRAGEHVTLPGITSIATSLGAPRVSDETWRWASTKGGKGLHSMVVSDADAAAACVRFADDALALVEPACGATVAVAYGGDLRRILGGEDMSDEAWAGKNVVLEVCGGAGVTLAMLDKYRSEYAPKATFAI